MMCKCGFENIESAKFCSECGSRLNFNGALELPKMVTVKEAHEKIFAKTISLAKVYDLIRTRRIPHVRTTGKILLDLNKTIEWWNYNLNKSMKPEKLTGLRKII